MGSSAIGTFLGLLPFILAIMILGGYLFVRARERRTFTELAEIRAQIRNYKKESFRLLKVSSVYSPNDPEPFGTMAEAFNNQLVEFEKSIAEVYEIYGKYHKEANQLKLVPMWKLWYLPLQWYTLRQEVESVWVFLDELQHKYQIAIQSSEKISKLGIELSTQSRDVVSTVHDALHIYHALSLDLKGETFLACGKNLKKWEETLTTQIPLSFLSTDETSDPNMHNKDSITKIHRVLKAAVPEVNGLNEKMKKWQSDLVFISSSLKELRTKHQHVVTFVSDLERRSVSPIQWDMSRTTIDTIEHQLEQLGSENELWSVEKLRDILHEIKRMTAKQKELESICLKYQSDYLDLLRIWSSMDLQNGSEWVRGTRGVLEQVVLFDEANWQALDDIDDFRVQFEELAKLQPHLLPRDPSKAIHETELSSLVEGSRRLYDLHQKLRPRLEIIKVRLKEIQSLQDDVKERLSRAKSVMAKTLPVIASNPLLKKVSGNEPVKIRASLDQRILEIDAIKEGIIEKKVQRANEWAGKAEQALGKWLGLLTDDLDVRLEGLGENFQTLGNFNNLEDIVITEVRDILRKAEQSDSGPPLTRPGDDPLLVAAKSLWAKNDLWQKVVSAGRALEDVAGPVLERYQKAEKSRQLALKRLERGNQLIPDEPGWPPTTQYLRNERKQAQTLENSWQSLRQEHIQAIQLVGKISDFSEQYHGLAIQVQQIIEKVEQEQSKIDDYERKLEESKRMWLDVVTKYPENKSLKSDTEKLFAEIDRDYDGLKRRTLHGGLPYNQVLQNMRSICRKINEAVMPAAGNQVVDINGELQKRLY